jgi:5-methylcytosine-specific restriction endonuclease McrA
MTSNSDSELAELIEKLKAYRIGEWNVLLGREQDWHCIYCEKDLLGVFDAYNSWQWDHVIPQSAGGQHGLENIVICCKTCNWLKSAYSPIGITKSDRILDAKNYVQKQRAAYDLELTEIKRVARGS